MKKILAYFIDPHRWLPLALAFSIGLGLAFLGCFLFDKQIMAVGIAVACALFVLFLGLLGLAFFLLRMVQQRARWENENFQIALKAELELKREERMAEQGRKRQAQAAVLEWVNRKLPPPPPDSVLDTDILALVQKAMNLSHEGGLSLGEKLQQLEKIVIEIQNTRK